MKTERPLLAAQIVAERLGVDAQHVYYLTRKRRLHAVPIDGGTAKLYREEDVERLISELREKDPDPEALTVVQVAEMFGVAPQTVRNWVTLGKLQGRLVWGKRVFSLGEVQELAMERGVVLGMPEGAGDQGESERK